MVLTPELARRIVDRVNDSLGKSVSVTQISARVIASTEQDLVGSQHPLAMRALAAEEIAEASIGEAMGVGLPLCCDDLVVGCIVLHDHPRHGRGVIRVVKTLAELLIHQATVVERLPREERLRNKFLSDLLCGRIDSGPDPLPPEAGIFEIDLSLPRMVVALQVGAAIERLAAPTARGETLPIIARARRLEHARADLVQRAQRSSGARDTDVYGFVDDRWLVLLATVDPRTLEADQSRVNRRAQRFVDDLTGSLGVQVHAGIGRHYPGWPALAQSFADARFAAENGSQLHGPNRVFAMKDLGLVSFLGDGHTATKQELARRLLEPVEADAEPIATLEAFLLSNLAPTVAAHSLNIHRHTLAYRLDKVQRLTGLDPRRFEDAMQFYAATLLRRLNGSSG